MTSKRDNISLTLYVVGMIVLTSLLGDRAWSIVPLVLVGAMLVELRVRGRRSMMNWWQTLLVVAAMMVGLKLLQRLP